MPVGERVSQVAGVHSDGRYAGVLLKAAEMLGELEVHPDTGANALAGALGIDRSTAYRLAQALCRLGWVRQDPETKRYRLGMRLWELGVAAIGDLEIRAVALPWMRKLVAATGESCDLAVLDGPDVIYIEKVDGTREVRATTRVGLRVPGHAVAMGKVLLGWMPEAERRRRLRAPLDRYTPQTSATIEEFEQRCADARRRGYAINLGEHNPEAGGLAVPILDRFGDCLAALGLNVPSLRMQAAAVEVLGSALLEAGESLSREMGFLGAYPSGESETLEPKVNPSRVP